MFESNYRVVYPQWRAMSDEPDKCSLALLIDKPALTSRPAESDLLELLKPLIKWQSVAIYLLPKGSATITKRIEVECKSDVERQKIALIEEWFKADPTASWKKIVIALTKAEENTLAVNVATTVIKDLVTKGQTASVAQGRMELL